MSQSSNHSTRGGNAKVVGWCLAGVIGMFGFGFAMVPLYEVFCDITGINGKTGARYETSAPLKRDENRVVTVQFIAQNGQDMPWRFHPQIRSMQVHPGESVVMNYIAENVTDRAMVGQAVPSLSPSIGTQYFHKTECFCFTQQKLEAGERVEMPVVFIVDPDLPEHVTRLTLSYTLYDQKIDVSSAESTTKNDNG